MRQVDRRAAGGFGIPEIVLMENAGLRLFDALCALYPDLARRRLLLLCGRGNNGGDTLVLARHLSNAGVPFRTLLFGRPGELRGSAGINLNAARRLGVEGRPGPGASHWRGVRGGRRALLPARPRDGHKGDFGHVLIIAGSRGKGGAARMAALAALRSGCGLVTAAVPASLVNRLLPGAMEVMTEPLDETPEGTLAWSALPRLLRLTEGKRAIALGPGVTTHPETKRLVRALARRVRVPMGIDADALN